MTVASVVRRADGRDEAEIWRLIRLAHDENDIYSLSEPKFAYHLEHVLYPERYRNNTSVPRGVVGVIGPHEALEAMIILLIGSVWYSDDVTMESAISFVDPAHRRSEHARALLGYAKHIVDGIRRAHTDFRMTVGILSTSRTAAKMRLFSQQLSPVGVYFCYPDLPEDIGPAGIKEALLTKKQREA